MKKYAIFVLSCLLCMAEASAQNMQFLGICSDAASSATAAASVAAKADAYAADHNPASMALSQARFATALSYGLWQPSLAGTSILSASMFTRIGERMAVSADFKDLLYKPYDLVTSDGKVSGSFGPSELAVGLGFAYAISDGLALGARARFASSSIAPEAKASAPAFDLAVMYASGGLRAGLNVSNIGGKTVPMSVRAGAAYDISIVTVSAEADYLLAGAVMAGIGAEVRPIKEIALRAGYHYGDATKAIPSYLSLGAGARFAGVSLDAAYLMSGNLGGSLMATLGYSF